jgi:hypothetical protein
MRDGHAAVQAEECSILRLKQIGARPSRLPLALDAKGSIGITSSFSLCTEDHWHAHARHTTTLTPSATSEDIYTFGHSSAALQMPAGRTVEACALDDLAWGICL